MCGLVCTYYMDRREVPKKEQQMRRISLAHQLQLYQAQGTTVLQRHLTTLLSLSFSAFLPPPLQSVFLATLIIYMTLGQSAILPQAKVRGKPPQAQKVRGNPPPARFSSGRGGRPQVCPGGKPRPPHLLTPPPRPGGDSARGVKGALLLLLLLSGTRWRAAR